MTAHRSYGVWVDRVTGKVIGETDFVQCKHCQGHIRVKPGTFSMTYLLFDKKTWSWKEEPGAWCKICDSPVCLTCHDSNDGRCPHFMREIERSETETAMRDIRARMGFGTGVVKK